MLIQIIRDTTSFALASNPQLKASDHSSAKDCGEDKGSCSSTSPGLTLNKILDHWLINSSSDMLK